MHYVALVASIVLNAASLVLLKRFATERESGRLTGIVRSLFHPYVLVSMACFALAAATWMVALAGIDLSVAYPSMSVIYALTALVGRYMFGERISVQRWGGIGLVIVGIALINAG